MIHWERQFAAKPDDTHGSSRELLSFEKKLSFDFCTKIHSKFNKNTCAIKVEVGIPRRKWG